MTDRIHRLADAVLVHCATLASYTEVPGTIQRTFLCGSMRDVHRYLAEWMGQLGITCRIDAAGNLRGLTKGSGDIGRRIVIGSHLDTVPNAGAYDGVLGVVLGIALVELLREEGLGYSIEVIGFSEEEGVRFGLPFIGSRAVVGKMGEAALQKRDREGITVVDAIRGFGLDPEAIPDARLDPQTTAYLELHIEQGPVLEKLDRPLGVVEAIAGQTRAGVVFEGRAGHAGTTPMELRRDALCAAAEWILDVEREAAATAGLVATVGKMEVLPGAGNVIAGEARGSLDVRHRSDEVRRRAVESLREAGRASASRRGVIFTFEAQLEQDAVAMDPALVQLAEESLAVAGFPTTRMVSGAGHDAMVLASEVPSAMIFLRSPGGISHHPDETVKVADVRAALLAGLHFLRTLQHATS